MQDCVQLEALVAQQEMDIKAFNDQNFTGATNDMTKEDLHKLPEVLAQQEQELEGAKKELQEVASDVAKEAQWIRAKNNLKQELATKKQKLTSTKDKLLSADKLGAVGEDIKRLKEEITQLEANLALKKLHQPAVDSAEEEEEKEMDWSATPEPEDVAP